MPFYSQLLNFLLYDRFPPDPLPRRCDRFLRTYQHAEMTSHALLSVQHRLPLLIQGDGLMASVRARDLTSAAADTLFPVKLRENHSIPFQDIGRLADRLKRKTDYLFHTFESLDYYLLDSYLNNYN